MKGVRHDGTLKDEMGPSEEEGNLLKLFWGKSRLVKYRYYNDITIFSDCFFFLRHYTSTLHILGFFWPFPKGYGKINALLIGILNRDSLFLSFCSWGMFPISNTYISVGGVHIVYMLSILCFLEQNYHDQTACGLVRENFQLQGL